MLTKLFITLIPFLLDRVANHIVLGEDRVGRQRAALAWIRIRLDELDSKVDNSTRTTGEPK